MFDMPRASTRIPDHVLNQYGMRDSLDRHPNHGGKAEVKIPSMPKMDEPQGEDMFADMALDDEKEF